MSVSGFARDSKRTFLAYLERETYCSEAFVQKVRQTKTLLEQSARALLCEPHFVRPWSFRYSNSVVKSRSVSLICRVRSTANDRRENRGNLVRCTYPLTTMSIEQEPQEGQQQEDIFDSLPYYDNDLDVHPILKQKVDAELAKENRKNPQTLHPKVPPPIELFKASAFSPIRHS